MKKLWILTVCCSALWAQNPSTSEPLEEASKDSLAVDSPRISDRKTPSPALTPNKTVKLSTEPSGMKAPAAAKSSAPAVAEQMKINPQEDIAALIKEEQEVAEEVKSRGIVIDLGLVFAGSPTIYSILLILSIASVGIWAYALLSLRNKELFPSEDFNDLQDQLLSRSYDAALATCHKHPTLLFGMVESALKNRHHGAKTMFDIMETEGKRMSASYWQKIGLLNEIAIIAPMLGLLGTVLGMFYAFYDLNRSAESISTLFDGLGISVGTTVGGLIVAILSLIFHTMTKYRLMKQLTLVESRARSLAQSITNEQE